MRILAGAPDALKLENTGVIVFGEINTDYLRSICEIRAERPDVAVVALVDASDPPEYLVALSAGATAAISQRAAPEAVTAAVQSALSGQSTVPEEALRTVMRCYPRNGAPKLSAEETKLLVLLSEGCTVRWLAREMAYSERSMHRALRGLYDRLGARNRAEAIRMTAMIRLRPRADGG